MRKPKEVTKIIPPETKESTTKIIAPALDKPKEEVQEKVQEEGVKFTFFYKKDTPKVEEKPKPKQEPKTEPKVDPIEELFKFSGTHPSKREKWYEYYRKAKSSRKQNSVVQRMKEGKFAITTDDKILILPNYDFRKKTSSEMLADKWI